MQKINPFSPNATVHLAMFVGREDEIEQLDKYLWQCRSENPVNFLLTGERGIGKSSLLRYVRAVAEGGFPPEAGEKTLKFLVVETDVDDSTTQVGLIQKLEMGIRRAVITHERALAFIQKTWDFIKSLDTPIGQIKDNRSNKSEELIIEQAAYSIADTVRSLCSENVRTELGLNDRYDGLLFLIDEADNASEKLYLGAFVKLLVERIQREGCRNVMIGLAGLPKVVDILRESHPSSVRLFQRLELGTLTEQEVRMAIRIGLDEAKRKNDRECGIDSNAERWLVDVSEGLPHFLQHFCYEVTCSPVS